MVLGTSAYRNGVRATMFSRRDLGIGYLAGEGDEPQITRTYNVDGPAAEGVVRRARVLREEAGRITGHALGEEFAPHAVAAVSVLDDIAAVVLSDETKVWCETVAARLAELRPETYAGWDGEQVTVALKPTGSRSAKCGAPTGVVGSVPIGAASREYSSSRPSRNVTGDGTPDRPRPVLGLAPTGR